VQGKDDEREEETSQRVHLQRSRPERPYCTRTETILREELWRWEAPACGRRALLGALHHRRDPTSALTWVFGKDRACRWMGMPAGGCTCGSASGTDGHVAEVWS